MQLVPVPAAVAAEFVSDTIRPVRIHDEVGEYHVARLLADLASNAVDLETRLHSLPVRGRRGEEDHVVHKVDSTKLGRVLAVEWVVEQLAEHPTIDKLVVPCQKKA